MKTINETFTDEEFKQLSKKKGKQNWHDFIIGLLKTKAEEKEEDNTSSDPVNSQ